MKNNFVNCEQLGKSFIWLLPTLSISMMKQEFANAQLSIKLAWNEGFKEYFGHQGDS